MTLVKVIPVHLIHSNSKHFLVFGIYSILDHAVVDHFVDVDCSSMTKVEYQRMSQRLRPIVECLILSKHLEEQLVKSVSLEEIVFDGSFEVGMSLYEYSFATKFLAHGLQLF